VRRFSQDPSEFLFLVDEAHLAPPGVLEEFFHVLSRGVFTEDDGTQTSVGVLLFWFTAPDASLLPQPLLSRCLSLQFEPYSLDEIREVLTLSAERCGYTLSDDARALLASAAFGIPRRANHLLGATIDGMVAADQGTHIDTSQVAQAFTRLRLHPEGLDEAQVAVLRHLSAARKRRLGVRTLAALVGRSEREMLMRVEAPLLRLGYVVVAAGAGRELTPAGLRYLKALSAKALSAPISPLGTYGPNRPASEPDTVAAWWGR
jgi:Holliday junction resolvasome RuvABC ATP-dependent DNA helicase subunit